MKKLIALVAVAIVGIVGAFAFDVGTLSGSWLDSTWNAVYTIKKNTNGEGMLQISDAKTGAIYATFTDANIENYNLSAGLSGVSISFHSKKTCRTYKFTAGLSKDLTLNIDRDWTDEPYEVTITWNGGDAELE